MPFKHQLSYRVFPDKEYELGKERKKKNLNNPCRTENSYCCLQQKGPKFLFQRSLKLDIYTKQTFDGFQKDRRGDKEIGIGENRE